MHTQTLIELLAVDNHARRNLSSIVKIAVISANLVAAAFFFALIGFRADIGWAISTVRFVGKFAVTIPLALASTAAILRVGRPATGFGWTGWAMAIAPIVLVSAVALELMAIPSSSWLPRAIGHNARLCLTIIPLLSIGPLICLLLALREGAPTRPGLAGAVAGLAASGIAATFYAANCTDDSPLFVMTWYPIAMSIVVAVGYLAGVRLLRW